MTPRLSTDFIVVHATMTPERPTVHQITWRARTYGYLDAGYHFIIDEAGVLTKCRRVDLIGTGCRPHNATSVSLLLTGSPPFTEPQLDQLLACCMSLKLHYPNAAVVGYRDLPGVRDSISPGFDVKPWWENP